LYLESTKRHDNNISWMSELQGKTGS